MLNILKAFVGIIMVVCFLAQMWELFDQFISELKTIAVSFKEEKEVEFPNLAFCDSTAFTEKIGITSNISFYNASTFDLEEEISLVQQADFINYSVEYFPTSYNGYCKLYEFHGQYHISNLVGKS